MKKENGNQTQRAFLEERALSRFQRAMKAAKNRPAEKRKASDKYVSELRAISGIGILMGWFAKRSIVVEFVSHCPTGGLLSGSTITMSSSFSAVKQLIGLLHEAGHVLVVAAGKSRNDEDRFAHGYNALLDPSVNKKFLHKVEIVEEELEAWHRGKKLAKKLGITYDESVFYDDRSRSMKTYFAWALCGKKYPT